MSTEERLAKLEVLVETMAEDLKELRDQSRTINEIVVKWRLGAIVLISLGAFGMWIVEHLEKVRRFFLG